MLKKLVILIRSMPIANKIEGNGQWQELRWKYATERCGYSNKQKTMISSVVISFRTLDHRVDSLTSI